MSAIEKSVTAVKPKSPRKEYSLMPSDMRSEKVVEPTIRSRPLKPDGKIKLVNVPLSKEKSNLETNGGSNQRRGVGFGNSN
jgi:hypothetical protein